MQRQMINDAHFIQIKTIVDDKSSHFRTDYPHGGHPLQRFYVHSGNPARRQATLEAAM